MPSMHKDRIAQSFSHKAQAYEQHAQMQRDIAQKLASYMPQDEAPTDILEIGCGTGFLTQHLLTQYPQSNFHITDIAEGMIEQCAQKFPARAGLRYSVLDGEHDDTKQQYDLIVSSMCVQWFTAPLDGLMNLYRQLKPRGQLYYAVTGAQAFYEWKETARRLNMPVGIHPSPEWPNVVAEEYIRPEYESPMEFLREMKAIGAHLPRAGYSPLGTGALKKMAQECEKQHGGTITWHIVYGVLSKPAL